MFMYVRSLKLNQIVPAIVDGHLPTDRGPLEEYGHLETLHQELLDQLKVKKSAFRANKEKHEKENFLYYDSRKRARPADMAHDGPQEYEPLNLGERSRDNLARNANEYDSAVT